MNYSGFCWTRWWGVIGISWTVCSHLHFAYRQITSPAPHHSTWWPCLAVVFIVTVLRLVMNRYLIVQPPRGQDVEWGYCFDIHLNAFFPLLMILHFFQLPFLNSTFFASNRYWSDRRKLLNQVLISCMPYIIRVFLTMKICKLANDLNYAYNLVIMYILDT